MEKFDVTILGTGSALPTAKCYNSSLIVDIRDKMFLVDCGEGTQIQLRNSHIAFNRIGHIFISHLHGDHCFGLIGLISTFGLLGRTRDLHIHAPEPLESIMEPQFRFHCEELPYRLIFHTTDTKKYQMIYEDRSLEVWSIPLNHRIDCAGFLFKEKPSLPHIRKDMLDAYRIPYCYINNIKAGADYVTEDGETIPNSRLVIPANKPRSFAYVSDTSYMPSIAKLCHGVSLMFHEATYLNDERILAHKRGHSTAREAARTAAEANAGKLVLGHFSSRYEDRSEFEKEARETFPCTVIAKENMTIPVL